MFLILKVLKNLKMNNNAIEYSEKRFCMLARQIKPVRIYYDNPGLIIIGALTRQPVSL